MRTLVGIGVALVIGALSACAPSGYSLQLRNNLTQAADVKAQAKKSDAEPRTVANPVVAPGATITLHTKAERDEKVTVEARVQGEPQSPPAVYPVTVGLSKLVINPNPDAAKDAKQPKAKIREDRN